jgi:hypothetical protein
MWQVCFGIDKASVYELHYLSFLLLNHLPSLVSGEVKLPFCENLLGNIYRIGGLEVLHHLLA